MNQTIGRSEKKCRCGGTVHDSTPLCPRCATTLDVALANIAAWWPELETLRNRQSRYGHTAAGRGTPGRTQPLVVDDRFAGRLEDGSRLDWETRNTIAAWARTVADERPPVREQTPRDTVASVCGWLQSQLRWIAEQAWAATMLDEMLDVERRLRRMVDRPPDRWYAGPCTAGQADIAYAWLCGEELYVPLGATQTTCRVCGSTYGVAGRRAWLLAAAEDRWETATTIARAVTALRPRDTVADDDLDDRLARRIRRWAAKGDLPVRDVAPTGGKLRPRYRLGDVLDLLETRGLDTTSTARIR